MTEPIHFGQIAVDSEHADRLARFYGNLLGRPVDPASSEYFARLPGTTGGERPFPTMIFLKVPEPRTTKNRLHLDLFSADRVAAVERAVALGAIKVGDFAEYGVEWTTLADPEGNVFDIGAQH